MNQQYPLTFSVDYPDRDLDRLSTFFRIFAAIPIAIVLNALTGFGGWNPGGDYSYWGAGIAGGLLFLPPLLMILFREKYPLWWQTWNRELLRFQNRVGIYVALMDDRYPSTDEQQSVHLDFPDVDAQRDLNRWMPLVKWLLAIPHYIVLFFLYIGVFFALVFVWFAILFTGRYPRGVFDFVQGVVRWQNRVVAYALILITDEYPPFGFD
jgi:fatty acid desaturase